MGSIHRLDGDEVEGNTAAVDNKILDETVKTVSHSSEVKDKLLNRTISNGLITGNQIDGALERSESIDLLSNQPVTKLASNDGTAARRTKKKLPWKGKTIVVLLPIDEDRGKPGCAPVPLPQSDIESRWKSWKKLGYDVDGFDINKLDSADADHVKHSSLSKSRSSWPSDADMAREREMRKYPVALPDLNAWKNHVTELNEAKLRSLGVSFGDEEPPLPPPPSSISPCIGVSISRQSSAPVYPPLPFSPPIPTSSASSNHGGSGFMFPAPFVPPGSGVLMGTSATQSPSMSSATSPIPLGPSAKYSSRQSISMPPSVLQMAQQQGTLGGFSSQTVLLQQGSRGVSPSLAALSSIISPSSPFIPGTFLASPVHQRHQSMQNPIPNYKLQASARASPGLLDLKEVNEASIKDEETKTSSVQHNASSSLQREIDDAEYHLEEQFRSQFEHDRAYSPHGERQATDLFAANVKPIGASHGRESSVQFAPLPADQRFRGDTENGIPLHHPRPHSRGHSLANAYFVDPIEVHEDESNLTLETKHTSVQSAGNDLYDIETTPSNVGTLEHSHNYDSARQPKLQHQRAFSAASNPWSDASYAANSEAMKRCNHGSSDSLSRFNVDAPEFKLNPARLNNFQTSFGGQFSFGDSEAFQPAIFQAGMVANGPSTTQSSEFCFPFSTIASSKINVNAPSFSPGQSEFSFSASGPKFRADAPVFTPLHSISNSLTSPILSGTESITGDNRANSIFKNIDLTISVSSKQAKRCKAVPIVRPASRHSLELDSEAEKSQYDKEGRVTDDSRIKRARASPKSDDNDAVLFAEVKHYPAVGSATAGDGTDEQLDDQPDLEHKACAIDQLVIHDQNEGDEDTAIPPTTASGLSGIKVDPERRPLETSPLQPDIPWAPFEFKSYVDISAFNDARPMEDGGGHHKKSLSATAKPFTPGASMFSAPGTITNDTMTSDDVISSAAMLDTVAVNKKSVVKDGPDVAVEDSEVENRIHTVGLLPPLQLPVEKTLTEMQKGLSASRYASSTLPPLELTDPSNFLKDVIKVNESSPQSASAPLAEDTIKILPKGMNMFLPVEYESDHDQEPTFKEIDDIMRHINDVDPAQGVNRTMSVSPWHQSTTKAKEPLQSSLSTKANHQFVHPTFSVNSSCDGDYVKRNTSGRIVPGSEWSCDFADEEQLKLTSRIGYFDGHVNSVMGDLLTKHLGPLEDSLERIQRAVSLFSEQCTFERRRIQGKSQESDADDEEDDEEVPPVTVLRSLSPRKDRRLEQMRVVFLEALASCQESHWPLNTARVSSHISIASANIVDALRTSIFQYLEDNEDGQSFRLDFHSEDLRHIVEDAVERQLLPILQSESKSSQNELVSHADACKSEEKIEELKTRATELEQQLQLEYARTESEIMLRRAADDQSAELRRKLDLAETKIEMEIKNRSIYDQRIADLDGRLKQQEEKTNAEVDIRRKAEDRLSEVQRLLRIASEEETRLREAVDERDDKFKILTGSHQNAMARLAAIESMQSITGKAHSDLQRRLDTVEGELQEKVVEVRHWRLEAERVMEMSQNQGNNLLEMTAELGRVKKVVNTLGIQLEENERLRDSWRSRFLALQEDMARAACEVAEESAHHIKKEQIFIARQEVLDAKLQAEARTRERLESELERLISGERQAMRAVAECKRLEASVSELLREKQELQQCSLRYQAELGETRLSMEREIRQAQDATHFKVNNIEDQSRLLRGEFEAQVASLRKQLVEDKQDAGALRTRLLEEKSRHDAAVVELREQFTRKVENVEEDSRRLAQNLTDQLSIAASRTKHFQEHVMHLEQQLDIAREAAQTAVKVAKTSLPTFGVAEAAVATPGLGPLEKISPQALRESILVLQEQLHQREERIEELEHMLSNVDPEAGVKIAKRDDEILWLRELLAVRHADLQDIVTALGRDDHDPERVRDAVIRLQANLQMEEQERERALEGGSAIKQLPIIAASIRDAATPRISQAVLPLAAAWGSWRRGRMSNSLATSNSSSVLTSSPATPSRANQRTAPHTSSPSVSLGLGNGMANENGAFGNGSFLTGLLTPPTSGQRQTPQSQMTRAQQLPTAYPNTDRKLDTTPSPPEFRRASGSRLVTPPVMRASGYDLDAYAEEFDDAIFFDN